LLVILVRRAGGKGKEKKLDTDTKMQQPGRQQKVQKRDGMGRKINIRALLWFGPRKGGKS
jgi:hypothetical protein